MNNCTKARSVWRLWVYICIIMCGAALAAQEPKGVTTLKEFFQPIIQGENPNPIPTFEATLELQHRLSTVSSISEIDEGLPFALRALQHPESAVRMRGAEAIVAIAQRPDAALVLGKAPSLLPILFSSVDIKLQRVAITIIEMVEPPSGSDRVGLLTAFLSRTDRDLLAQAGAFSLMLRYTDQPGVLASTSKFLSRKMDPATREALVNGIANSRTEIPVFTEAVLSALRDQNEGVRFTAVQALWRMPSAAVVQAEPTLESLVNNALESESVRTAARQALARVEHRQ